MKNIFVFGASGHAKVVIDILERTKKQQITALLDDDSALWGETFFDYPVVGGREYILNKIGTQDITGLVAIGANKVRMDVAAWLTGQGFTLCSAIHPHAQIARDVQIGAGTVVMAGVVINSGVWIGDNVVINTAATIDHDSIIENGAHIAPGCNVCGGVCVGEASLIGVGSAIIPGIKIGKNSVVGAGSTVIAPVHEGERVVGSPACVVVKK